MRNLHGIVGASLALLISKPYPHHWRKRSRPINWPRHASPIACSLEPRTCHVKADTGNIRGTILAFDSALNHGRSFPLDTIEGYILYVSITKFRDVTEMDGTCGDMSTHTARL